MTPLERAARAVDELLSVNDELCATPQEVVRAVLQAIREPSGAMAEAGGGAGNWSNRIADDSEAWEAQQVWQTMIDAALEEV